MSLQPPAVPALHADHATARAAAALDQAHGWIRTHLGPPDGAEWVRADGLADPTFLDMMEQRMTAQTGGRPTVAASYLTSWVASVVMWPLIGAPLLLGQRPDLGVDQLWVGENPEAIWIDRIALAGYVTWVPAAQPDPMHVAFGVQRLVGPLIEAFAGRRALGRRALWNAVADDATYLALEAVELAGGDDEDGITLARELSAALPHTTATPEFLDVWRGPDHRLLRLKQACCLAYTTPSHLGRYCLTCPFNDEDGRNPRYDAMFHEE